MFRKMSALLLAVLLVFVASCALAESKISVNGTGEIQVSADNAVITLGVNARDKEVLVAQQKANEAIAAIRKALIARGVAEENINTDYLNIYPIYDYHYDGSEQQEEVVAYNASSTLAIRVTDMDQVGILIDDAFGAGANNLNGVSFSVSDAQTANAEALKAAVAEAKAKAEVLAEAAGLKIVGIETISDGGVYNYGNTVGNFSAKMAMEEAAGMDAGSTVVQAAKIIISATVNVTFIAE